MITGSAAPALPGFLPFYFRVCAFSIQRTQLCRSLEQASFSGFLALNYRPVFAGMVLICHLSYRAKGNVLSRYVSLNQAVFTSISIPCSAAYTCHLKDKYTNGSCYIKCSKPDYLHQCSALLECHDQQPRYSIRPYKALSTTL